MSGAAFEDRGHMQTTLRCAGLWLLGLLLAGCGAPIESKPAPSTSGMIRNPTLAPKVGREVPEIEAEDIGGARFKLSDFRGKVVVLDFWGFWCPHCVRLIPHEKALVEKMKDRPFALLGVNSDSNRAETERYIFETGINWRSWWDGSQDGPIARRWQPAGFPMLYVIDHRGILRRQWYLLDKETENWIERLVSEAEAK